MGHPQSGSSICQSRVSLMTELDDKKLCYHLITIITISAKTHLFIERRTCNSSFWTLHSAITISFPSPFPISFFPPFFGNLQLQMVSCCYGLWNQFCDWWTYLYVLSVIGWCKCLRITGVRLQATVQLHHRFHLAMVCFSDMHVKSLSYTVTILTMSGRQ